MSLNSDLNEPNMKQKKKKSCKLTKVHHWAPINYQPKMSLFPHRHPFITLTAVFLGHKLIHLIIIYLTSSTFDLSSTVYTPVISNSVAITQILSKLRHWDAVYFAQLFETGPRFEHEWVFSPFWWRLINWIPNTHFSRFISGVLISNLSQLLSSFVLYEYTQLRINDLGKNSIALRSAVLFLLNPMGVFGTAPYSENVNTLMTFIGLYLIEAANIKNIPLLYCFSSFFFEIAFWTRSNSLLLGSIYFYDFVTQFKKRALFSGILFGIGIVYYNYLPYMEFCTGPVKSPWCKNTIPSLFSYAQSKYWKNGFLSYWTPNNIPNFIIALPQIILLLQSGLYFKKFNNMTSLVLVNFLFLIVAICFINVQIVLRISSFMPLQFWYISALISQRKGYFWITWMIVWNLFQCSLFAAFLPPA